MLCDELVGVRSTYLLTASFLKGSVGVFLCWTVKDLSWHSKRTETLVISPRCVLYNGARATLINGTIDDRCSTCISRSSNSSSCSRTGILDLQISNSKTATAATKGSLKKVFDP
ncbi:hypothetical protein QL285_059221 [Trifolium repens]|nr:hypothetical protein QL285_059221 [Trifolium repens]